MLRRPGETEESERDAVAHFKFMKEFDKVKSGQMYEVTEQKARELRRKFIEQEKKGVRMDQLQGDSMRQFRGVQDLAVPDYSSYMDIDELENRD